MRKRQPAKEQAGHPEPLSPPPEDATEARLLERAQMAVSRGIAGIEVAIKSAAAKVEESVQSGDYDNDAASHLSWITQRAAQIAGEIRKIEAHDKHRLDKLTPAMVIEWYRALSDDEKAEMLAKLTGEGKKGLLAL